MATIVTIGGTQYEVHEMNFIALERAWPSIEQAMISRDPMAAVSAALSAISAAVMEEEYYSNESFGVDDANFEPYVDRDRQVHEAITKFFKRKLKATEIEGVRQALQNIAKENGLVPEEGEADPLKVLEAMSLSTETSEASSQNSSQQDAKEEAGPA